jgi:hypothetical protein
METLGNMTLYQLFRDAAGVLVVASVFIEITPIKINPVSTFLKWLGKKINADLVERINKLERQVETFEQKGEERNIISIRARILRFGDEVRHKTRHSKEHFDQILSDIDDYEKYCDTHKDFKNNRTTATTAKILEVYKECVDQDDFL